MTDDPKKCYSNEKQRGGNFFSRDIALDRSKNIVYYGNQNKLFSFDISNSTSKELYQHDDNIGIVNLIDSRALLILGKNSKKITLFNLSSTTVSNYVHSKKISGMISIKEENFLYIIFSDKFGEINLKSLSLESPEGDLALDNKAKNLFGHCDPITYIDLSSSSKLFLSSDCFGKIKIYQYPNLFNVLSVILYPNEEIGFANFIGDEAVCVLNQKSIDLWSMYDFKLQKKIPLDLSEGESVQGIKLIKHKTIIVVETNSRHVLFDADKVNFELKLMKELQKEENKEIKFLDDTDDISYIEINKEGKTELKILK